MSKRPPTYTFRRPRNPTPPPAQSADIYTVLDKEENSNCYAPYSKYSFCLLLLLLVLFGLVIVYVYLRGLPVRIRG